MTVEEEYLDVLQNIEFAIVSTYRDHREMRDGDVIYALEAAASGRAPEPKRVDEIVLCLKRIRKSVNRWNKSGGQRGYLSFIVQYVR